MKGRRVLGTLCYKMDPLDMDQQALQVAGAVIREGGLVAFPTETVYGLGADAMSADAVARIFQAKGRPTDNPLIVHVADPSGVEEVGRDLPPIFYQLVDFFWPGPLTLVLPRNPNVPDLTTAGLLTVAVRMPAHPVAIELIRQSGCPIAAPSANRSGRPSPTTAEHVLQDLAGSIHVVLDGGPAAVGVESTVLDLTGDLPVLLRPGGVTVETLREIVGEISIDPSVLASGLDAEERPRSPGMKYRHYAPEAPLWVVEGAFDRVGEALVEMLRRHTSRGERVGMLVTEEMRRQCADELERAGERVAVAVTGSRAQPEGVAAQLFAALRRIDDVGVDVVLAEGIEESGVGLAVMNRLRKASGGRIVRL